MVSSPTCTTLLDEVRDVLAEAKYFWLRCYDTYHEVPAFGYNLDATIQALRNVTFRLQACTGDDGIASWYSGWRTYLKQRPETAWLNNARVGIVHRKGLAKHSSAVARLLYTYGEVQQNEYAWSPIMADEELVDEIRKDIDPELAGVVLVLIDRRWVAEDYPSAEVLNLLADCFTVLSALVGALAVLAAGGVPPEPKEAVAGFVRDEDMRHVDGVVRLCVDPFRRQKVWENDRPLSLDSI